MQDPDSREEMDRLREPVEKLQWQAARQLLESDLSVVLENGFWRREERLRTCRAAQALGAKVTLHFLDPPKDELLRRIDLRNRRVEALSLHITSAELITWLGWLERPDEEESAAYDVFQTNLNGDGAGHS